MLARHQQIQQHAEIQINMNDAMVPAWLLGRWRFQGAEPGLDILPGTRMEFQAGGQLMYTITLENKEHVFNLSYEIEGTLLRTNFTDGQHTTEARFHRLPDGRLQLHLNGIQAWFVRESIM
jgi:hypothetical protein